MKNMLLNLSPRERLLVAVMCALLAVVLLFVLIIQPAQNYRRSAENGYQQAQITAQFVRQAVANQSEQSAPTGSASELRRLLTQSAAEANLSWTNLSANQADSLLTITYSNVASDTLFQWLVGLQRAENVVVVTARMTKNRQGGIDASISFLANR